MRARSQEKSLTRRLAWVALAGAVVLLAAACSSSDGGSNGTISTGADASPTDPSLTAEGGASDGAASSDSPADALADDATATPAPFALTSAAFAAGGSIPAVHTCNGTNDSPPLAWTGAPAGTQSFAIVMRDLTLGGTTNYHWVIYDIPAGTTSLPQGIQKTGSPPVPAGAKQTYWSFGASYSYLGPCPPALHDYQFTVYSFPTPTIAVAPGTTSPLDADTVIQASKTASATLTGQYHQ